MSEKLKVGVIGTGVLGRFHTKLYSENSKVELVGVYDAFPAAAEKVAAEFGTKAFAAIDDLVDQCDALTVAVPATLHHESVMPLIAKGKHILVENPSTAMSRAQKPWWMPQKPPGSCSVWGMWSASIPPWII